MFRIAAPIIVIVACVVGPMLSALYRFQHVPGRWMRIALSARYSKKLIVINALLYLTLWLLIAALRGQL